MVIIMILIKEKEIVEKKNNDYVENILIIL
jgi:hypothetical protein